MSINQPQLSSFQQEVVLRTLAESVEGKGVRFLEIGSWMGDSTVILAKVAQERGGYLFCVDWWHGNIGTELEDIAAKEDVFANFWRRIRREGLQDTVMPIRSSSDIASDIFKKDFFDLIFLDADHRHSAIRADIKNYSALVKRPGGILCGHDCEGRISDFDRAFLELGKDADTHESVHCGVVLAVGLTFKDYSIDHGIWSVRAIRRGWAPTALEFKDIAYKKESLPPSIGGTMNYDLFRYGDTVYAVPIGLENFDIAKEENQNLPGVIKAKTINDLKNLLDEEITSIDFPVLLDSRRGYNFVRYKEHIYGMAQVLGDVDLARTSHEDLEKYQESRMCIMGDALDEVKLQVDDLVHEILKQQVSDKDRDITAQQAEITKRDQDIKTQSEEYNKIITTLQEEIVNIKRKWWIKLFNWKVPASKNKKG